MYGDTLRNLISPARSLQLRQSLLRKMDSEPTSAEGLLRHVSWSIECGAEVEDRQLLRAAVLASRLYEDELARKAAVLVKDPELQMAARAVIARTRYNASDYVAARDILDADFGQGNSIPGLLAGSLLWAAAMSALGHTPAEIMKRAQVLRRAAERLAAARPDDAEAIQPCHGRAAGDHGSHGPGAGGRVRGRSGRGGVRRGRGCRHPAVEHPRTRRSGSASTRSGSWPAARD